MKNLLLTFALLLTLGGCSEIMVGSHFLKKAGNMQSCKTVGDPKIGNPYLIDGIRYTPINTSSGFTEKGIASWYGSDFHGKPTANGECYNMYAFTAAHRTLPLPTIARVTNLENNRSVVVKINDRGPFARGRVIDLSYAAAQSLGVVRHGTAPVLVEAIGGAFHEGGSSWRTAKAANPMGKNDKIAETLPTVVPPSVEGEDLGEFKPQAVIAENQVPPPAQTLPKPPAFEKRVATDTEPLQRTRVYVQVGAFAEPARATAQQLELGKLYPTAHTSAIMVEGKQLLRVRAGPFRSIADADAALEKVLGSGFNAAQIKVEE